MTAPLRDRIVQKTCNLIINLFATRKYRTILYAINNLGVEAFKQELQNVTATTTKRAKDAPAFRRGEDFNYEYAVQEKLSYPGNEGWWFITADDDPTREANEAQWFATDFEAERAQRNYLNPFGDSEPETRIVRRRVSQPETI